VILGRPANLWTGLVTAGLALVQVVLVTLVPDADPTTVATILGAVGIFLGVLISFIANTTPTINAGDQINVTTPAGQPNATATLGVTPAGDVTIANADVTPQ
jgi:hypothetical protein